MSIGLTALLLADILAVTPVPQDADTNSWWMVRHREKVEAAQKGGSKVVFIGDSITHFWERWHFGFIQWEHYFKGEPYKALNLGFSADRTEHVLWRLDHGELDGYEAKAVVLMVGTNNLGHREEAPIDTVLGIRRVVEKIREKQPTAKVILCGILPRGDGGNSSRAQKIARINRAISAFADGRSVVFCDFGDRMLTADGRLLRGIMPDLLHPAGEGYEIWANAVIPYINWALTAGADALPMASLLPAHVNPAITDDDCDWHQGVPQSRINRCVNSGREWWWFDRMAEKRREVAESVGKIDLVFLGDSITHNWENDGKEELAALRKKYSVLDLGYGADGVQHLLWRLEMGELDGYEARGVMMMIGTNNGGSKEIVPVVAKTLDLIKAKQPKAKILLCGMLPLGRNPTHGGRKPRAETNALLRQLAAEQDVEWIDFGDKLLDEKGFMPSGGMWNELDWVHPKAPGYRIWRAEVEPIFDRWLANEGKKSEK